MTKKLKSNIWLKLRQAQKPFLILAPMEEVTDTVFRRIVASCGRPDLFYTEFTNCEGVQSVGQAKVIHRLRYTSLEKPIIAQVWGITPEDYYKTAKLVLELGFDGLDINMGCPVKKIVKQGACSALIKNPNLAKEIVQACREGSDNKIPLSIKTRIGFQEIETESWLGFLIGECQPESLIIHGRTVKEQSKVSNHWEEIAKAVKLRDNLLGSQDSMVIVGNGDIQSWQEAEQKAAEYSLDGIMIGRGVFANPWIFNRNVDSYSDISPKQRLKLLQEHILLYKQTWGEAKNYNPLKRFFKIYVSGFAGAATLRSRLMTTTNYEESLEILEIYDTTNSPRVNQR